MTDVIGWGEDTVRVPRWRSTRRRRVVAGIAAVAFVAIAVLAVPAKNWLTGNAARHLAKDWATVAAVDEARRQVVDDLLAHAGAFDGPKIIDALHHLDREEIGRLTALRHDAASMHTWDGAVAKARKSVLAGIDADLASLRRDLGDSTTGNLKAGAPLPATVAEFAAENDAGTAVFDLARRHHFKAPTVATTLHAADALVATLHRPTDSPTGLRLVTVDASGMSVVDLDTGHGTQRTTLTVDDPDTLRVQQVGDSVLVTAADISQLVPIDGGRIVQLGEVLPLSLFGDPLWAFDGNQLVQIDGHGHRTATPVEFPRDIFGGNEHVLTADDPSDPTEYRLQLWSPRTGALRSIALGGCDQEEAYATSVIVAAVLDPDCTGAVKTVVAMHDDGRLIARIPLPRNAGAQSASLALSPDGSRLAVVLSPLAPNTTSEVPTTSIGILDLATRRWTVLANTDRWSPASWSPDGRTLLLTDSSDATLSGYNTAALWRVGNTEPESLRWPVLSKGLLVSAAR